jgi:hypothetical protein
MEVMQPTEKDLQNFILENWANIFPKLTLVKAAFVLDGNVKSKNDKSGRIDMLAFNPTTNKLVVIELKRDFSKTILQQSFEYSEFIENNFSATYLQITQKYGISLPNHQQINTQSVEIILVAKSFSETDTERAKSPKNLNLITLVKYQAFSFLATPLYVFDFVNNEGGYFRENKPNNSLKEQIKLLENILGKKDELLLIARKIHNLLREIEAFKTALEFSEETDKLYLSERIEYLNYKIETLLEYRKCDNKTHIEILKIKLKKSNNKIERQEIKESIEALEILLENETT